MTIERRRGIGEIREVAEADGARTVTLRAITPGVVDDYGSVWMADTFDGSLAERLPTLVWGHAWTDPIGRGVDYRTGDGGPEVIFEFDDFDAVPRARQAYAQTKSGTIRDCSVGFFVADGGRRTPTEDERGLWPGVREVITKARLDEVSLVLAGAVPGAKVLSVRSGAVLPAESAAELLAKLGAGSIDLEEALRTARELASEGAAPGEPTATVPVADDAELEASIAAALETLDGKDV